MPDLIRALGAVTRSFRPVSRPCGQDGAPGTTLRQVAGTGGTGALGSTRGLGNTGSGLGGGQVVGGQVVGEQRAGGTVVTDVAPR